MESSESFHSPAISVSTPCPVAPAPPTNSSEGPICVPERQLVSPYGYLPTQWICILYLCLFSTTTALHVVQALYKTPRLYWVLPTIATCGIGEIIGWSGRLWSSHNPFAFTPYLMQITTTIIAPTFLTAGLYTILGTIIRILGPQYSRLKPTAYLIVFLCADLVALVVQAIGGAKASTAFQAGKNPNSGGHIMLGGIFLQLAGLCIYTLLAAEFLCRFVLQRPIREAITVVADNQATATVKQEKSTIMAEVAMKGVIPRDVSIVISGIALSTLFVLIRTVYRSIELINGWTGRIILTQRYFNILDGAPITLAMFILNALNPRLIS